MRTSVIALLIACLAPAASPADSVQTDWSGGPAATAPVPAWDREFAASANVSWLAVPGQVALSTAGVILGASHPLASGYAGAFGVATGDLDGDGDVDVVGAAEGAGSVTIWYSDGASPPAFTAQTVDAAYPGVSGVVVADLDKDGDLDIVVCCGNVFNRMTCYLNDGSATPTWTAQLLETNWSESWELSVADVDSDGNLDVVGTNLTQNTVAWWRNDGAQPIGWTRNVVDATFTRAHSAVGGDLDGDGRTDIVATGTTINQVAWWRNEGGEPISWSKSVLNASFIGGRSVRVGDIDADGDLDVCAVGFNGRVTWWSNEGGDPVAWSEQLVDASLALNHQLQLADVSGDGLLDLVVVSYGSNAVVWFENGGGALPITWTKRWAVDQLNKPLAGAVGDVDGDGALEVVATSNTAGTFGWYEPGNFVSAGELTSAVLDLDGATPAALAWEADVPAGAGLAISVRAGDDPAALGAWSAPLAGPGALPNLAGRYFQYRAELTTAAPAVSPVLRSVALTAAVSAAPQATQAAALRAYPNPANPRTVVAFALPRAGRARVEIFDLRGRRVRVLHDGEMPAGERTLAWDGADDAGRAAASGVYQVVVTADGLDAATRVALVR